MVDQDSRIQELTEALEKATGPDRELANEVLRACGWQMEEFGAGDNPSIYWIAPDGEEMLDGDQPDPTASIDAAMTLQPEGANCWGFDVEPNCIEAYWSRNNVKDGHWYRSAEGKTPAIALCIAALRARAALEGTK